MAITIEYLPLDGDELPVSKVFTIGNQYKFLFRENVRHEKIYLEIYDADDNVLYTTRLVYAGKAYHAVVDGLDLDSEIIPFNVDDLFITGVGDTVVNKDNLDRVTINVLT